MAQTIYWVLVPATESAYGNSEASAIKIKDHKLLDGTTDAVAWGSEPDPDTSGSQNIDEQTPVTGLQPGTQYRIAATIWDGVSYGGESSTYVVESAAFRTTLVVSCNPGAAAADGSASLVSRTRRVATAPGAAVAAGSSATVTRARVLAAAPVAAVAAGSAAAVPRIVNSGSGAAQAAGATATVARTRRVAASPGVAQAEGATATITTASGAIMASPGAATAAGATATVARTRRVAAAPGAAAAAGGAATVSRWRIVSASPASGVAAGAKASLPRTIMASPGAAAAAGGTAWVQLGPLGDYVAAPLTFVSPSRAVVMASASRHIGLASQPRPTFFNSPARAS